MFPGDMGDATAALNAYKLSSDFLDRVPIPFKMTLTIKEAAAYSNIGINKINKMLQVPGCSFVLYVGYKKLVKRQEFERFIKNKLSI